jgi:hypothetical protein
MTLSFYAMAWLDGGADGERGGIQEIDEMAMIPH